ncbi:MAG: site-specific integrase [Proteobacteria bacterium]|nr:site-specific integrase [Pseudomonadota bacterium]
MTLLEDAVQTSTKKRPSTKRAYCAAVRRFVDFAQGDLSGAACERWRDALIASGLSPRTVCTKIAAIKFASKRLELLGHHPNDFARGVEFPAYIKTKKRFARPMEEAARMLDACRGPRPVDSRDFAMFTLGFRSALRRESLVNLKLEDIDGRKFKVLIKGGRIHELFVDDEVIAAMAPWIEFLKRRGITTGYVFRSLRPTIKPPGVRIGAGLHPSSINTIMNERCELAGLRLHPHLMRHCTISWLLDAGASVFRVQQLSGHRDPASVQEYAYDTRAADDPVGGMLPALRSPAH